MFLKKKKKKKKVSSLFLFIIYTILLYFTPLPTQYKRKQSLHISKKVSGGVHEKKNIIVFALVTKLKHA